MKVLEINSVCGIRSTGRICTDIADVLRSEGHSCMVAYGRENVPDKYKGISCRIGNNMSVKTDAFLTRIFDNAGFNSKKATKEFISKIKEYDPDIIHLHNLHGYYINLEILFKYLKESKKPVIWTLHDCWAFTGHCSHYVTKGCERWKTGCFSCPKKKAYPGSLIFDNSKRNYKKKKELFTSLEKLTIVTPSEWLASQVRASFLRKYEVIAIPNGVNLETFKPTASDFRGKYHLKDKKIILGVATAWSGDKGLKLFSELAEKLGDTYKVVLVGITPEVGKTLPDSILKIPRTNSIEELAEIYTASDVFLNLGKAETMGLTTVEAMACGTPVVTSNCTAVPEVVTPDGGIVAEKLTAECIMECIKEVLSKEYKNTRSNAEKYEKNAQYMKYIELYKKCK